MSKFCCSAITYWYHDMVLTCHNKGGVYLSVLTQTTCVQPLNVHVSYTCTFLFNIVHLRQLHEQKELYAHTML